jgi:fructuronate reductase
VAARRGAVTATPDKSPEVARLSRQTLDRVPHSVRRPARVPPHVGIVHLGIGAFHRAHQAVFTEDAAAAVGSDQWGILGVTQRSAAVQRQLQPQDGLYTVLERGAGAAPPRVVGVVREVVHGGADPDAVTARIADPAVQVVSLTVTEKGYRRAVDGSLDRADDLVRSDLSGAPPRTAVGLLVRGLQTRQRAGADAVTVLCCDNLVDNGTVLRGLVRDFCAALPTGEANELETWIAGQVRFPSTMVDRIVPATTDADRAEVRALLGVDDAGVVVTEPFRQWVITDDFAGERPPWELAGVVLTRDVAPWETAKLRLLNASHSLLAYLGALRGYDTIAEAMADEALFAATRRLMFDDVLPTLAAPDGLDLPDYCERLLARFANPALLHRTVQVAMDGSQKLPTRVLGTIRDRLEAGATPHAAALVVAAWMTYVARAAAGDAGLPLDDPLSDRLAAAAVAAGDDHRALVVNLLQVREIFGADLSHSQMFREILEEQVAETAGSSRH